MVTIEMTFASGAEAVAYFFERGFTTVEDGATGVRVMDDGVNVVRIEHLGLLEWKATILSLEDF